MIFIDERALNIKEVKLLNVNSCQKCCEPHIKAIHCQHCPSHLDNMDLCSGFIATSATGQLKVYEPAGEGQFSIVSSPLLNCFPPFCRFQAAHIADCSLCQNNCGPSSLPFGGILQTLWQGEICRKKISRCCCFSPTFVGFVCLGCELFSTGAISSHVFIPLLAQWDSYLS